ncbi:MAG: RNA-directed DNA polymerase [Verrucomicrobia bacterium]|nr:RNA-directed DNA polymerase [Verrucomicrobiota bacterium]
MSLLAWLKRLFGREVRRDVAQLERGEVDAVAETVDLTGPPLRPHGQRRAWRDRRLVPKRRSLGRALRLTKRQPLLSRTEADRLFSGSARTRDRQLRDLAPDEEQLRRYGLPVWRTEQELANALELTLGQLRHFAIHRERERQPHYFTFAIPKRSGGERHILAPKRRLKALQRRLLEQLFARLPVGEPAHGFRRGRSVRTAAEPHVGQRRLLQLDLQDFFPSLTFGRVRGLLIGYGYGFPVANALALLVTECVRQPVEIDGEIFHVPVGLRHAVQGAPTSPAIANALVLRLDRRLAGLARRFRCRYTRYADDLTFSGELDAAAAQQLRRLAGHIIRSEGFAVNAAKTRSAGPGARHEVTGVTVNEVLGLSREERRCLRAAAHRLHREPDNAELAARLHGQLAYLHMLNPAQAERLRQRLPTR